jgi:catechol 2,3-dioxygenase-like lactoylglutathione lyase family enzyme
MHRILGIDHVAFAAHNLEATCAFYDRLFGIRVHLDHAPEGWSLVRQIALGGALSASTKPATVLSWSHDTRPSAAPISASTRSQI